MTMENASCAQLGNQGIKEQELNTENELVLNWVSVSLHYLSFRLQ